MVVDSSALLALLLNEPPAEWVLQIFKDNAGSLRMSTVNLAEVLIRLEDLQPQLFAGLRETILTSGIRFVPPTESTAVIAASARMRFPLNLGDCFTYALAKEEGVAILTLDADFCKTDVEVLARVY